MSDPAPALIEVALNGITSKEQNPSVPREPGEIVADALRSFEAGAAIVHTHIDDFALSPEAAAARYLEAYEPIVAARPDAILYPTIGGGSSVAERYGHHEILARSGTIRAGVLDPGSVNLGAIGPDGLPGAINFVYVNSPHDIQHMLDVCNRNAIGASIAIYEPGFLRVVLAVHAAGKLPPGSLVKFYFSESGYLSEGSPIFSAPPIPEALDLYLAMLGDSGLPWAVAILGGSILDSPVARIALERGGHLRVGLEDHVAAKSNVAEVDRARALCAEFGRSVATPADAAQLLGLPPRQTGHPEAEAG